MFLKSWLFYSGKFIVMLSDLFKVKIKMYMVANSIFYFPLPRIQLFFLHKYAYPVDRFPNPTS